VNPFKVKIIENKISTDQDSPNKASKKKQKTEIYTKQYKNEIPRNNVTHKLTMMDTCHNVNINNKYQVWEEN